MNTRFLRFLYVFVSLAALLPAGAEIHDPDQFISGTLPVLYINTEGGLPITSKIEYISGTYWLDSRGLPGCDDVGSSESPLTLQIKGRGNKSWKSKTDKKPYRLKFDKKASLCGMKKDKHWVLLPKNNSRLSYYVDESGFELSRRASLAWTPEMHPVEVVLNGDYYGLYLLCEKIRVDKDRVNIEEQADFETDPDLITGGWLFEIDNHTTEGFQESFYTATGKLTRITWHSPDSLSTEQHAYLCGLYQDLLDAIYIHNKYDRTWETLVDVDTLARFYLVNEILDEQEAFIGSCYIHKRRGADSPLIFGPVWDFDYAFKRYAAGTEPQFIYQGYGANSRVLPELAKFPRFQKAVREAYTMLRDTLVNGFEEYITAFGLLTDPAGKFDHRRWGGWGGTSDYYIPTYLLPAFRQRVAWLDRQWFVADVGAAHLYADTVVFNKSYRLNEPLTVGTGVLLNDSAFVFVSNSDGVRLRLCVPTQAYADILAAGTLDAGSVYGYLSSTTPIATLTLFEEPHPSPQGTLATPYVPCRLTAKNAAEARPADIVRVAGIYDKTHKVIVQDNADTIAVDLRWAANTTLQKNTFCFVTGIVISKPGEPVVICPVANYVPLEGDLNLDDTVDVTDLQCVFNVMLGLMPANYHGGLADTDRNGVYDVSDVNTIVNIILGRNKAIPPL